jgi:hypothetical protein
MPETPEDPTLTLLAQGNHLSDLKRMLPLLEDAKGLDPNDYMQHMIKKLKHEQRNFEDYSVEDIEVAVRNELRSRIDTQAFIDILKSKHPDIVADLKRGFSTQFESWEEIERAFKQTCRTFIACFTNDQRNKLFPDEIHAQLLQISLDQKTNPMAEITLPLKSEPVRGR